MYIIRKTFKVEYAHQLHDAFTKCCAATIHGHSGKVEVYFASNELDHNDMVIDFGEVSSIIKNFLEDTLDHALIVPITLDPLYIQCLKDFNEKFVVTDNNPTAEYFAESLYWDIADLLRPIKKKNVRTFMLWKIRFHETDTGYAEFQPFDLKEMNNK